MERDDGLWHTSFQNAQWVPTCKIGGVTRTVVRDEATGTVIHDSGRFLRSEDGRVAKSFRKPRNVDVIVEVNLAETSNTEATPWEEVELCPREASEYRAAAARLNYT